jgi:hypothetical protein
LKPREKSVNRGFPLDATSFRDPSTAAAELSAHGRAIIPWEKFQIVLKVLVNNPLP